MYRPPSFVRALLLLFLVIGPLQAQTIFACAMMDTVVYDQCCCEDHERAETCTNPECDPALDSPTPCCEQSVEIGVDADSGRDATIKQAELRFDADPPPALLSSLERFLAPHALLGPDTFPRLPAAGQSGSDTWLVTRRLRI